MASRERIVQRFATTVRRSFCRLVIGRHDGIRGAAAIEFAILASILILLMIGVVDIGMGFYRKMQVQTAAQAGAHYAMRHGFVPTSIANAVTAATAFPGISASPAPTQYCGCPSNTGITIADCTSTCPGGLTATKYVAVSAQGTYNTILTYPTFPNSFTLAASSTVSLP
jgi:Flp pilus assembly protein TadG